MTTHGLAPTWRMTAPIKNVHVQLIFEQVCTGGDRN